MIDALKKPWLIEDGTFVYQLNDRDVNVFSFQVQGGYKDDGTKTTQADKEQLAALIVQAVAVYRPSRDLLRDLEVAMEGLYDGAPDSPTRWMGEFLERIQQTLAGMP